MKKMIALMLALALTLSLAACGGSAASSASAEPESSAAEAPAESKEEAPAESSEAEAPAESSEAEAPAEEPAVEPAAEGDGIRVAFSNSFFGNAWRSQAIKTFEAYARNLQEKGVIAEYTYSSAGNDAIAQINDMRNFISAGYDVIVIDTASSTALVDVCEEAMERGIPVCAFDNDIASDKVYNVNIDQIEFGRIQARYVCEQLNGEGNVIIIRGPAGTPVDNDRQTGIEEILAQYPNIKVVTTINGEWDAATTQTELTNAFNAFKGVQIDGLIGVVGFSGTYEALLDSGIDPTSVVIAGAMENLLAQKCVEEGINAIGANCPCYGVCTALDIALAALAGEEQEMYSYIPITYFTAETAKDYYVPEASPDFFCGWTNDGNTYELKLEDCIPDK